MGAKGTNGLDGRDVRKNGSRPVTRAEFEEVRKLLDDRGDVIDELRRDVQGTFRDLADDIRRELQTQLTRIAQLQQEIDTLKKS